MSHIYMFIYVKENLYVPIRSKKTFYVPICDSRNDRILKTLEYFQNININIVFLLIIFYFLYKISLNICTDIVVDFKNQILYIPL